MRTGALDFGTARVGAAISDDLGRMAHPRAFFEARSPNRLLASISDWAREEAIERLLVGLPKRLDGSEGLEARRARKFASVLARELAIPVELVDERMSTVEARRLLREQGLDERAIRGRVDSAAAALLLQTWLDGRRPAD